MTGYVLKWQRLDLTGWNYSTPFDSWTEAAILEALIAGTGRITKVEFVEMK